MKNLFKIVKDNATSIRGKCKEVTSEEIPEVTELLAQMKEYLALSQDEEYAKKHNLRAGVGLAAPQIGKNICALVVYYDTENENKEIVYVEHRLINPKIVSESVKLCYIKGGEGCLSVDNEHQGYIYRPYKIIVKAFDAIKQKEVFITARGFEAVVLQHEIDHLHGILYYDHIDKKDPFKLLPDSIQL